MFSELYKVVTAILDSIGKIKKITDKQKQEKAFIDVFSTYYVLKNIRDDAVKLLNGCNWDPKKKISSLSESELKPFLDICDDILRKQGERLYLLERKINSDQCLSFMDDELHQKLLKLIGHKSERVANLHSMASNLIINAMFDICDTPEDRVDLILRMSGLNENTLNVFKIKEEIDNFSVLLKQYKSYSEALLDKPQLIEITRIAKINAH